MNKLIKYCIYAGVVMAMASCHHRHREPANPADPEKAIIVPTIALNAYSRGDVGMQTTAINDLTKAGFFVTEEGGRALHTNVKHGVNNGTFRTEGEVLYWPTSGNNVNIYAYAPYAEGTTLNSDMDFTVSPYQDDHTKYLKSDLLIGTASNPVTNNAYTASPTTNVSINFTHKLSKVIMKFVAGSTSIKFDDGVAKIHAKTGCKFNVSTGAVTASVVEPVDIYACSSVHLNGAAEDNTCTCCAIIVPQTITAGTEFITLTTYDAEFSVALTNDVEFKSGYEYVFEITIAPEQSVLTANVSTLSPWTSTEKIEETAEREKVIHEGDFLLANGTYVKSYVDHESDVIGYVVKVDDFDNGYKALAISTYDLKDPYKFGNGSLDTVYVATSGAITSAVKSGLYMMDHINKVFKDPDPFDVLTAFYYTLSVYPYYNEDLPDNTSQWLIPSAYEMKLILEHFSEGTSWTNNNDQPLTEHGKTSLPEKYASFYAYKKKACFPTYNDGSHVFYWTCTPASANEVWIGKIGHSSSSVGLKAVSTIGEEYKARVVPILYSR